jgi:hypothetical protein
MRTQVLLKDILRREELDHERRERQLEKIAEENAKKKELFGIVSYEEKKAIQAKFREEIRMMTDKQEELRKERVMRNVLRIQESDEKKIRTPT